MNSMPVITTPTPVDESMIADVLRRAHQAAEELNDPHAARTVLLVAQAFADALVLADPDFDRLRFIETATEG